MADTHSSGGDKMENARLSMMGCLLLCTAIAGQEQPRVLKGGGHLLGETVEQFYSEGYVAELLRACRAGNWKSVNRLYKNPDHSSKNMAKDMCAKQVLAKQQATAGSRVEYKGGGDEETMRADKFVLDGGQLVRIEMVYNAAIANIEGSHPKSFAELLAGLQEAYGEPTKTYSEAVVNTYGVKYEAHRAVWMGKLDVIRMTEQPGADGWTEIVAETLTEYNRATRTAKSANPLQ
jgi:hypothetical protein